MYVVFNCVRSQELRVTLGLATGVRTQTRLVLNFAFCLSVLAPPTSPRKKKPAHRQVLRINSTYSGTRRFNAKTGLSLFFSDIQPSPLAKILAPR